jgi:ligand-binding sensor domain-containing protein
MPHSLSSSVAQTGDGYLWIGSEEGLSRVDGARFTNFDRRKTEGIPANVFTALAVDRAGTLWAGTRDRGVLHAIDGEFRALAWEPGPQEQQIRALAFDGGGDLWIGMGDRGLVRLHDGAVVDALTTHDGLPSDDIRALLAVRDGTMWIGTFGGLARWTPRGVAPGPAALAGITVYAIAADVRGDLWCATDEGLAHVRGAAVDMVRGLPGGDVHQVMFDRDGNLWVGTGAGVVRVSQDGRIERLPMPDVMVRALFEDSEGNVWIGSERGLDRLRDGDVVPFGASEGLTDDTTFGVREDSAGAMWITASGGLYRIAPGQTTATRVAGDRGAMYEIYEDPRGDVWFGSREGDLGRWRDGQLTWLGQRRWEGIRAMVLVDDGLWLGTEQGLFFLRDDRIDDAELILPGLVISGIARDATGALWLATESNGLMLWRDGVAAPAPPDGPPRNVPATTITFDADGTMWVGTEGAGLWRLRDGAWSGFTAKDGLFDDLIWRILDDGLGNLWMSSNRGIWKVSRAQLEARAAGRGPAVDSVVFTDADGMRNRECDGDVGAAGWRARDGRLWFPTAKGVVAIDPAHVHEPRPRDALIESVRIDGEPQKLTRPLVLAPGTSRIELVYAAPALRDSERLRFRYRLDGFDHGWNDAGTQRAAQYTNLAPGDYRFVVEAGVAGAWGDAGTLAVTLRPTFVQTRWFLVLAILSIALAIVSAPLLRVRQLRARARELDRRVQEAIGELKVLSGLLPICAWCKKIRDDGGYWNKIEAYLSARTDAQFTHGICPECTDKMLVGEDQAQTSQRIRR